MQDLSISNENECVLWGWVGLCLVVEEHQPVYLLGPKPRYYWYPCWEVAIHNR